MHTLIAEHLSARQLILLHISFCVYMYVCPSRLGMLIFYTQCALELRRTHAAALLLSAGHSTQLPEYDGSIRMMDDRPYQGGRRSYVGVIKGRRALRSLYVLIVQGLKYNYAPPHYATSTTTRLGAHARGTTAYS